jgi:hypothetical protein
VLQNVFYSELQLVKIQEFSLINTEDYKIYSGFRDKNPLLVGSTPLQGQPSAILLMPAALYLAPASHMLLQLEAIRATWADYFWFIACTIGFELK